MNRFPSDGRRWLIATVAISLTVGAAFAVPVRLPERDAEFRPATVVDLSAEVAAATSGEDLGRMLTSRRWGGDRPAPKPPAALPLPPEAPSLTPINPVLLKMNYIGLITVRDERTVLLASPNGRIVRYAPGDTLPDGRVLVSVTDNSISLKAEGLPEEELMLFPSAGKDAPEPGNTEKRDRDSGVSR